MDGQVSKSQRQWRKMWWAGDHELSALHPYGSSDKLLNSSGGEMVLWVGWVTVLGYEWLEVKSTKILKGFGLFLGIFSLGAFSEVAQRQEKPFWNLALAGDWREKGSDVLNICFQSSGLENLFTKRAGWEEDAWIKSAILRLGFLPLFLTHNTCAFRSIHIDTTVHL